jgi:hypothetical protein
LDGPIRDARFRIPHRIAVGGDGCVYVTDIDRRIRVVDIKQNTVWSIASDGTCGILPAPTNQLTTMSAVALDKNDTIYTFDNIDNQIRKFQCQGALEHPSSTLRPQIQLNLPDGQDLFQSDLKSPPTLAFLSVRCPLLVKHASVLAALPIPQHVIEVFRQFLYGHDLAVVSGASISVALAVRNHFRC